MWCQVADGVRKQVVSWNQTAFGHFSPFDHAEKLRLKNAPLNWTAYFVVAFNNQK